MRKGHHHLQKATLLPGTRGPEFTGTRPSSLFPAPSWCRTLYLPWTTMPAANWASRHLSPPSVHPSHLATGITA